MSFDSNEIGESTAQPIEIYTFIGTFETWRLTGHIVDVKSNGHIFERSTIKRTAIENSAETDSDSVIEITLPFDHPMIFDYVFDVSPPKLLVQIHRCHVSDFDDVHLLWAGPPTSFSVEGREASLRVPSILGNMLDGICPAPKYQAPCNHVLYDARCKVSRDANTNTVTVVDIRNNGRTIEVNEPSFADGDCVAGEMVWEDGSQNRMITHNEGAVFDISFPFSQLTIGETVKVRRGCDHSKGQCKTKFNNFINFGGFPTVPSSNPFTKSKL